MLQLNKKTSLMFALSVVGFGLMEASPLMAGSVSATFAFDDGSGIHGQPLITLTGSYVKAVETQGFNPTPDTSTPDSDYVAGTARLAFSPVGFSPSQVENYLPNSPNNPGPAFTDAAGHFNDTAGARTPIPVANVSSVDGTGFSFTYAAQPIATTLEVYVGGYDVTGQLSGNGTLFDSEVFGSDMGHYGVYTVSVAEDTAVTFNYLAVSPGGAGDLPNVSIFAADSPSVVPVPLPNAASVGFWMLSGFGAVGALHKRVSRRVTIA